MECDWYIEPTKKTYAVINRLSRGFALAATNIADLFKDIYLSGDIKQILNNPDKASVNPEATALAASHFVKAVAQYMPDSIWE